MALPAGEDPGILPQIGKGKHLIMAVCEGLGGFVPTSYRNVVAELNPNLCSPFTPFAQFAKPMTATLADLRELTRSLSAFAAFQPHYVSTFTTINFLLRKIISLLTENQHFGTLLDIHSRDSAARQRAWSFQFSCFFLPAAIAALFVSKLFPVEAITWFESRIS